MSLHRSAPKRDASEKLIVDYLRKAGCSVALLSGKNLPDLLVGYHGRTYLAEVKTGKRRLEPGQIAFADAWGGDAVCVLRSVEDAQRMLRQLVAGETEAHG